MIIGVLAFLLYVFNSSSTVTYGGDSGELIAASYRLGIAHPTGYVLYGLLGRLFASLLPFGEVAWRYNIFSALCGALCLGVLTRLMLEVFRAHVFAHNEQKRSVQGSDALNNELRVLGENGQETNSRWPEVFAACGASGLLVGFYFFFGQCTLAEVYSLNAFMLSLLLFCAWRWHVSVLCLASSTRNLAFCVAFCNVSPDWRWLWTLGLLFGLAMNAHMSCAFLLPALVLWCVWHHRQVFRGRLFSRLATLTFWTLCGFALTLYLPLRSSLFPTPENNLWWPLDWTHPANFASWYAHIRAKQYEFLFLQPTSIELFGYATTIKWFVQPFSAIPPKLLDLTGLLFAQWLWCLFLVPFGAWTAWKRDRALGGALMWILGVNFAVQVNYNVSVWELANFLFPAYIVMTLWMGFGLHALFESLRKWSAKRDSISSTRSGVYSTIWSWRARTVSLLVLLATCVIQLSTSVPFSSTRGNTAAREAALERAGAMEQLAQQTRRPAQLWMASDDAIWSFWYAQWVLGRTREAQTPWGINWRKKLQQEGALRLALRQMQTGELALSFYMPEVDRRFPLVPFDERTAPRGIVWRASRRQLPLPAQPVPAQPVKNSIPNPSPNIEYSKALLSKALLSKAPPLRVLFPAVTMRNGIAHLKRSDMTRLALDFRVPWNTPLPHTPIEAADSPPSVQAGWVQILVASPDFVAKSSVTQSVFRPRPFGQKYSPEMQVRRPVAPMSSVQTLRLVVPQNTQQNQTLRAVLPMQIDVDSGGKHTVWLRLVRNPNDHITPWTKAAAINITAS